MSFALGPQRRCGGLGLLGVLAATVVYRLAAAQPGTDGALLRPSDPAQRFLAAGLVGEPALRRTADELARRGLLSAALARYARLVVGGGLDFAAAAAALVRHAEVLLDDADAALLDGALAVLPLQRLAGPTRRGLVRVVAMHNLRRGALERADLLLGGTEAPSALYLRGVIALRRQDRVAAQRLFAAAWSSAQALQRRARTARARDRAASLRDLSSLALARLADHPARALMHYREVAYGSPHFFRARQELAWVALRDGQAAEALVQSATLAAPPLAARYFRPDAAAVEAAALLALCYRAEAANRARQGEARLGRLLTKLVVFLRPRREVRLYYIDATASIARKSDALPAEMGQLLLADPSFQRTAAALRAMQRERAVLHGDSTPLRVALAPELDARLIGMQQRAGQLVVRLVAAAAEELRQLRVRCAEILFDAQRPTAVGGVVQAAPRAPEAGLRWPFRGEHWPDEVGDYRLSLPSRCR